MLVIGVGFHQLILPLLLKNDGERVPTTLPRSPGVRTFSSNQWICPGKWRVRRVGLGAAQGAPKRPWGLSTPSSQRPLLARRPSLLLQPPQIFRQNSRLSYCTWNPALETLPSKSRSRLRHTLVRKSEYRELRRSTAPFAAGQRLPGLREGRRSCWTGPPDPCAPFASCLSHPRPFRSEKDLESQVACLRPHS